MSIATKAEYKGGNMLAWPIVGIAVYLLANLAILSGLLFLAGGLALMPRFRRYVWDIPRPIGIGLIILAFVSLP